MSQKCTWRVNGRRCGIPGARRYTNWYACPLHTPAALAGLPEIPSPPPPPIRGARRP